MSEVPVEAPATASRLSAAVKTEIQEAYRAWLGARSFRPRRGQREMIAQIARTLTSEEDRIAVIEAGTGTGKTAETNTKKSNLYGNETAGPLRQKLTKFQIMGVVAANEVLFPLDVDQGPAEVDRVPQH